MPSSQRQLHRQAPWLQITHIAVLPSLERAWRHANNRFHSLYTQRRGEFASAPHGFLLQNGSKDSQAHQWTQFNRGQFSFSFYITVDRRKSLEFSCGSNAWNHRSMEYSGFHQRPQGKNMINLCILLETGKSDSEKPVNTTAAVVRESHPVKWRRPFQ